MNKRERRQEKAYLSAMGGIFEQPGAPADAQSKEVSHYAVKVTEAGLMIDAEFFPVWSNQKAIRKAKAAATPEAQRRLNARNTKRYITQLVHQNFDERDLCLTLTFDPVHYSGSPPTKEVKKALAKYFKAVRRERTREGLGPLKYLYVIEGGDFSKRGRKRVHIHIVMSGMDRDEAEQLWAYGRANTRRLQPKEGEGLSGLCVYMTKTLPEANPQRLRRWGRSRNLEEPVVRYPAHRLSRRRAAKLLADPEEARERLEASFPGYRVSGEIECYCSDFVGGVYVRARLFWWGVSGPSQRFGAELTEDWEE